ncbi:hypothetical protein LAZ67_1002640 [Cordylochernes scorpioides]|uniref:CCHC-type domain-containing protein n=1 Tax=Cordylochernes scorpioides TaxID=51811 RepID=A0ABY6JW82_9ARAC|nr:hypothetical protein LAZ67_1002640 [Cordylochernes scorpioides]
MFSEGREDVNDEGRAGRPSTSTTDEKNNEVEKMILAYSQITVREVAEDLKISTGSCHSIFINDLGMSWVAAKFVPKLLNCDQKQHRMNIANEMLDSVRDDPNLLQRVITGDEAWVYGYDVETKAQSSQWKLPHEPRPKKSRQVRSNVKVLLTVFFDCRGVVHHDFLPQGRTVNKEYYPQVMRNLRVAIRQKRPDFWKIKNWLLHHDNASAHTSLLVRYFLAKNNTLMMPQPPYSPDLAPCDFFLFPKLKRPIKGRRYATLDEIKTASKEELKKNFKNDFLKCFEDWKNRWHKHKRRTETVKQEDSVELKEMTVNIEEATQVGNYFVQHLPRNPSMFSGEDGEDPLTWLKGYKRVAKHNHWDETLCLANVYFYLNGTALKWFENNEETIRNWEEFTTQLESVFGESESLRLLAEKKLKIRAQLKGESTEFYIQDVLRLCKEVDLQMSEGDKISHLMKGIVEELYQALLPRDINNTDQFVSECRRIEALHRRRVTPAKYERLPNVASLDVCDDNTDLSSMIRQIVREEVQRALAAPREEPRIATIEDMVREEIDKTLAPISNPSRGSPQYQTYTPSPIARRETSAPQTPRPRARYPKQGERLDTNEWRTTEGRPICFHCGRPGHVARYCRDRRRQNDERENGYSQRRQEPMFFCGPRSEFPALNDDEPRDNFRRYRSPSPYPGRNGQHSSPIRGSSRSPRRSRQGN